MYRRLAIIIGCVLTLTGATLWAFTTPAGAHHEILSGVDTCSDGEHVIDWSIGNSSPTLAMTITSANAVHNGTTYAVDGYASPVAPSDSTSATSTLPVGSTGTVTITVSGIWPDEHTATRSADVTLLTDCAPVPTTTPPTTAPPTTAPPTTGPPPTTVVTPSTPHGTDGGSGTPCNPVTSTTHCKPLAYTGIGRVTSEALLAFGLLLLGGVLLTTRRRGTYAAR